MSLLLAQDAEKASRQFVDDRSKFDFSNVKNVAIIPIEGMIDEVTDAFIKKAVAQAQDLHADFIIFEMHTLGGRVDSAQGICKSINSFDPLPSAILVKQSAISAGALIAIANNYIFMEPEATIGDARPVVGEGPTEEEKYVSFIRAEFEAQALANDYNPWMAMAMVDSSIVLFEIELDGQKKIVDGLELEKMEENLADESTINNLGVFKPEGKLLVLSSLQALDKKFIQGIVNNRTELYDFLGISSPTEIKIQMTWSENFAKWLTNPVLVGLLMTIGFIGIYMEFQHPGLGLPGAVAVICFVIVFGGKYVSGLAGILEIVILLLGLAFLLAEVFLTPGVGFLGITGVVLIAVSLVLSLQSFVLPENPIQSDVLMQNIVLVLCVMASSMVGVGVVMYFIPEIPGLRTLVNPADLEAKEGYVAVSDYDQLLNQRGMAETPLRPAGKVRVGKELVDAVTRGNHIEAGEEVVVKMVEGNRIVVQKVKA
ncbi:nodulation protein NfeD [Planctomycetota bacterium]